MYRNRFSNGVCPAVDRASFISGIRFWASERRDDPLSDSFSFRKIYK